MAFVPSSSRRTLTHLRLRHHHLRLLSSSSPASPPPPSPPSAAPVPGDSTATGRPALDPTIRRLARSRRFSAIESLIERRKNSAQASDEPYLAGLILSYASAGMIDHAIRTFENPPPLAAPRTALSFNALLSACNHSKRRHFRRVPDLFADLSKNHSIAPDKVSYGILIKSHCLAGNAKLAFPILKEMETKKIEITTIIYTTILDSLYKEGKPEEAEKLWKEMGRKCCALDLPAYNVRVMYRALHGKPKEVLELIAEIESAGMKPDTITYNYLMTCYCKYGRFEDAKKVYKGLKEKGCTPNTVTYQSFLISLCRRGDFDAALGVFTDSVRADKVPDLGTVKLLAEGLVKGSKLRTAKKMVRWLKGKFPEEFVGDWKKLEKLVGLNVDGEAPDDVDGEAPEEVVAA